MKKKILCLSRSYLSKLLPTLAQHDPEREYFHIVQNQEEEKRVKGLGGTVIFNIETAVREGMKAGVSEWNEPNDFRKMTGFDWSPLYTDRYLLNLPENRRLRVAGALFKGIEDLFRQSKFDYFLSEPVALFTTHILYYFCRKNQVQCRFWVNTYFPGYFFFASQLDYSRVHERQTPTTDDTDLDKLIENFCHGVAEDKAGPVYHFSFSNDKAKSQQNYLKQRTGDSALVLRPGLKTKVLQCLRLARSFFYRLTFPLWGDFQSAASFREHLYYFKCLVVPKKYYDDLPTQEDPRFVTYTLQYEPEASLLYAAPNFFNQIGFVEMILRSLPSDKILYVKEHPNQFGALGLKNWRELRKRYHNVRYIYGRESGRKLIRASSMVVTISSSAGMDALLLGKNVVVAGRVFYDQFPNVTRISSYQELPTALRNPGLTLPRQQIIDRIVPYLKQMAAHSYEGDPQPSGALYSTENLRHLTTAIATEFV